MIVCSICGKKIQALSYRRHVLTKYHLLHLSIKDSEPVGTNVGEQSFSVTIEKETASSPSTALSETNLYLLNTQYQQLDAISLSDATNFLDESLVHDNKSDNKSDNNSDGVVTSVRSSDVSMQSVSNDMESKYVFQ
jgi:hypothetical protein